MTLTVDLGPRTYTVTVQRGALASAGDLFHLDRKVLIVTDSGVPAVYAETVARQCSDPEIFVFPAGEESKNITTWTKILDALTARCFTRSDCVVAVGGGVCGDMAGFAAACYLRGIDFYNIPTTLLAQIDSSVGGKTGIDYNGFKNTVGAFYQPKGVLIDPDVLSTLDPRQYASGMAEAVKTALIRDGELFEMMERGLTDGDLETVIYRCLQAKAKVVAQDENEAGLRQILNFGHTLGHGIESASGYTLLHGECVALGMIPMCAGPLRRRLLPVLESLGLPTRYDGDLEPVFEAMAHDKKRLSDGLTVVRCNEAGTYELHWTPLDDLIRELREVL